MGGVGLAMERRDRHANAALDLNMRLQTDWLAGGRHGDEGREGRLEDSLRLVKGNRSSEVGGKIKEGETRERKRWKAKLLIRYPSVSWKLHF